MFSLKSYRKSPNGDFNSLTGPAPPFGGREVIVASPLNSLKGTLTAGFLGLHL